MIKEDPEDSVRDEQHGANLKAAGTEDTNEAENAEKTEPREDDKIAEEDTENTEKPERAEGDSVSPKPAKKHPPLSSDLSEMDQVDLPPVDYSGFSKNELVETLALIIENRPPSEIRNDVERI